MSSWGRLKIWLCIIINSWLLLLCFLSIIISKLLFQSLFPLDFHLIPNYAYIKNILLSKRIAFRYHQQGISFLLFLRLIILSWGDCQNRTFLHCTNVSHKHCSQSLFHILVPQAVDKWIQDGTHKNTNTPTIFHLFNSLFICWSHAHATIKHNDSCQGSCRWRSLCAALHWNMSS